ncbi:MAG: radical SAM family heme chaperone HemW [Candidatus Omnitrophica bacterium]|nr:radical SAM family heme chaperone HemW [Candidatus Omnitrophota bacterium]
MLQCPELSLYVHIPFCVSKCPYCSFAVAAGQLQREAEYCTALAREAVPEGRRLRTVYIGGGTPSCLSEGAIERLFQDIRRRFNIVDGAEVTFELNPESVTLNQARLLKSLGVNRVSLGVQSLNDRTLEALGRPHRCAETRRAFHILRAAGFVNINVDLIYGLPGQSRDDVLSDLAGILELNSEHVSLYALNIEERSLFFARRMEVDNDAQGELYGEVCRRMEVQGVAQYEISNFARSGAEARHNMNYWQGGEYLGLGMSAHSYIDGERFWNADTLPKYLALMAGTGTARAGAERLAGQESLVEHFLFGLRMNRGVDLGALEQRFGREMAFEKKEALTSFMELGLLEESGEHIRATARGRLVLDEISARIV